MPFLSLEKNCFFLEIYKGKWQFLVKWSLKGKGMGGGLKFQNKLFTWFMDDP